MSNQLSSSPSVQKDSTTFVAVLKDEPFTGLDREIIGQLCNPKLRTLHSIDELRTCMPEIVENTSINGTKVQRYGLSYFFEYIKEGNSRPSNYTYDTLYTINTLLVNSNPVVFEIEDLATTGQGDEFLIITNCKRTDNGKPLMFSGSIQKYLSNGLSALKVTEKLPSHGLLKKFGTFHESGNYQYNLNLDALQIKYIKNTSVATNTISCNDFAILPKNGPIKDDVVVLFQKGNAEFRKISQFGSELALTPFEMPFGITDLDISENGVCVQAKLDLRNNFIIGIFESGGEKKLCVLRLDNKATLFASFAHIEEILGFENNDVVCRDSLGKIRYLDCNFESYDNYSQKQIPEPEGTSLFSRVEGGCESFQELFASRYYTRALSYILTQSNPYAKRGEVESTLEKVRMNRMITKKEQVGLNQLLNLSNMYIKDLGNNFISTLDVVKTGKRRFDPVDELLYEGNNPNAEGVISEFASYLMNYEHVIEADEVKTYQGCCCVYKIGNSYGLKYVHDKISKDILDCKYAKIDIGNEKDNQITVSYELADSKGSLGLDVMSGSVGSQIITSSEFIQQSNLDENGVGYAKMKNNKYSFVRLRNGELQRVSDIEFDNIELQKNGLYSAVNGKLRKIAISTANDIVISMFDYETMKGPDMKYNVFGKDTFIVKHGNFRNFLLVDNEEIKEIPLFDKNGGEFHDSIHSLKIEESDLRGYTEEGCLTIELGSNKGWDGYKQYIKLLKNGDVFRSPILKSIVGKRGGISDSKLILYKFDEVNDVSYVPDVYTIIGYGKKNDIITKTDEGYIKCFDESYNPKDAKELCGDKGFGGIVTTNKDSIYFVIKGTEVLQVDYEISDKSKKDYDGVYFVSIKKNGKYGILMYKDNEQWGVALDCIADTKPNFLDDHIFYGGEVYEIKGTELSVVKHDFDEIIRYDGSVVVKKEGKYYFAAMRSPGSYSVIGDAFDSKPEIFENHFVAMRNNQYVLGESSDQMKTTSELYTFAIKPDLQLYEKFGSLIFEKEGSFAILTKQQLVAGKLPSIQFAYSEVGAVNDKGYIRLRKRGSSERAVYDFLTKEGLFISNDKVDCIYFDNLPENDTTVVGTTDEYRKALYAIEKGMIYRISDKSWSYCETEHLSNSMEGQTEYTMELYMFTDSSYNSKTLEFEYILKKKLLGIDHVSYFRLRNNAKKRSEFKIENGILQKSAIIGWNMLTDKDREFITSFHEDV